MKRNGNTLDWVTEDGTDDEELSVLRHIRNEVASIFTEKKNSRKMGVLTSKM